MKKTGDNVSVSNGSQGKKAIVVGSGISGMSAAWRLQRNGFDVTVLEASETIGGRMSCKQKDGYTLNIAATLIAENYSFIVDLIKELGLYEHLNRKDFNLGTLRGEKIHYMRSNHMLLDGLTTDLLSFKSKLTMAKAMLDAFRFRTKLAFSSTRDAVELDRETAAAYAHRRLNRELLDYVVDPAMASVWSTLAEDSSVADFFFAVAHYTGAGGWQYIGGVDFIIKEIAKHVLIRTECAVHEVLEVGKQVRVSWQGRNGAAENDTVDAVVIAVPTAKVAGIYPGLHEEQKSILGSLKFAAVMTGHFGLSDKPDIPAQFIQVPPCEGMALVNMVMSHIMCRDVTPPGKGLITHFYDHLWSLQRLEASEESIVSDMMPQVNRIIPGVENKIEMVNIERNYPGILMSSPGDYAKMARMLELVDPSAPIQLAGDYFMLTNTNSCAISGDRAAKNIIGQYA